jgi:hypothetical protein
LKRRVGLEIAIEKSMRETSPGRGGGLACRKGALDTAHDYRFPCADIERRVQMPVTARHDQARAKYEMPLIKNHKKRMTGTA